MVQTSDNFEANNPIADTNMLILVTSWEGHRMFLKYTLTRYMESGKYVICSYDSHGDLNLPKDVFSIPHSWTFKHKTYGATKRNGWLWDIVYGAGIVKLFTHFDYVFTVNSDCCWDKPYNVDKITKFLDHPNKGLISSSSNGTVHTCNVLWRRECFLDFVSYIIHKLEKNLPQSHSPEVLLRDFLIGAHWNHQTAPIQPRYPKNHMYAGGVDHYSAYHQDSTWKEILGYRNLGGELKTICQEHLNPLNRKYFDLRDNGEYLNKHERETLYEYYMTGDYRYLYMYFDQGEDSFFNRRYFPIEYYGNEVLLDDNKRKIYGPYSERTGFFDRYKYNSYIIKDDEYYSKWKKIIKEKGYA